MKKKYIVEIGIYLKTLGCFLILKLLLLAVSSLVHIYVREIESFAFGVVVVLVIKTAFDNAEERTES